MENRHYFTQNNDDLASEPKIIYAKIMGESYQFKTDNGVFSKDYLDYATKILLENLTLPEVEGDILDVGCGYGPIGIFLAKKSGKKAYMLDVNRRALELAKHNVLVNKVDGIVLESNCLDAVLDKKFSCVVTNPPIRAGKQIVYQIFAQSYEVLLPNGELWIVIQQKHGAPSAIKKLEEIFRKFEVIYKKKGFFVIKCTKKS